jgi:hypothetical protein
LKAKTVLCRLLVVGLLATIFSLGSQAVAPSPAQAHDQGTCLTSATYVSCIFVKHGLAYVSNKFYDSAGAQYKCGYSRIRYRNSAGSIISTVYGPEQCANALQYLDYPSPYEKTYARKVCVWWYLTYPIVGTTPVLCKYAPW